MPKEAGGGKDVSSKSSVDTLKRRLYAREADNSINTDVRTPLSAESPEVPLAWEGGASLEVPRPVLTEHPKK
jgi:hypothetical protein